MKAFIGDAPVAAGSSVLADRRELALVAVERTRMPMVVSDPRQPDAPIVMANKAFLELTGYSASEVLGRNCRFLQGPDTAPEAVEAIRQGLAADEHFVTVEMLNYRKDGSSFWNQLEISPVHNESGQTVYYFASQKDVTARRRAQELAAIERLLLMEVDHRAMNALAMVQSILNLTRADDVIGYSSAVRRRVELDGKGASNLGALELGQNSFGATDKGRTAGWPGAVARPAHQTFRPCRAADRTRGSRVNLERPAAWRAAGPRRRGGGFVERGARRHQS